MIVVEAAVAAPVDTTLHYLVPEELAGGITVGKRLLVPLGRRHVTAYCLALVDEPPAGDVKLRPILDVLDAAPLFPAGMIPFFHWIARYYLAPVGEVIGEATPGGLIRASGRRLLLTDSGRAGLAELAEPPGWLADLLTRGGLSAAATAKVLRRALPLVERWRRAGFVELVEVLSRQRVTAKTETCVRCPPADFDVDPLQPSERKTIALIRQLADGVAGRTVPRRAVTSRYPGSGAALRRLASSGRIQLVEEPLFRDPFGLTPPFYPPPERLSGEQQEVLAGIEPAVAGGGFAVFLLHGITGSGKTEVYLRATAAALAAGRSAIVLVPEIALATQLEAHFHSRFGSQVALLHSGLSAGERYDQWRLIASGAKKVVVGARSAVFAPLADPGLIIVDEEHDGAYKQEDGLCYNGRDLAVMRANLQGAVALLGSATPSLVSYANAKAGKYRLLRMALRVEERPLPEVEVVDLKGVPTVSGRMPIFSPQLTAALKGNLARGEQSLVFLNRRGFANLMICQDCGAPVECRHCKVTLTQHKNAAQLVCHHCGYSVPAATVCAFCSSTRLVPVGFGTERLEEELRRLLPAARISRLDRDTAVSRRDFYRVLREVREGETDILIGTQMITKGHHFPGVTLVGVVWADAGLGLPDYKAGERTFQLLSQVMGRAGRGEKPGRVIIQAMRPGHYSIDCARRHDYAGFVDREMDLRRDLGFPPFSRLAGLLFEGESEEQTKMAAMAAKGVLDRHGRTLAVLGPAPAPLYRLRDRYRWHCLLKSNSSDLLHRVCREVRRRHGSSRVKLSLDIDPENLL